MEDQSCSSWRVTKDKGAHYFVRRAAAENHAAVHGGEISGYVPGVGWTKPSKIANEKRGVDISKVSIELCQEGNTMGTTCDPETLTIELEYQVAGDPPFVVLRTNGWSFDSPDEVTSIISEALSHEEMLRKSLR